ncbi:MAG: RidA family protein [Rhizobiales bacterium]|nr:RidA family protein [Hyphomicrobiales bacterium]
MSDPATGHQHDDARSGARTANAKRVIGDPIVIGGRTLSLSRAVRAGDFVFLTGQIPMKDGAVMTTGSIEEQTRVVLDEIGRTLALAGCTYRDVVKAMVWLRERGDFPGFDRIYGEYFPSEPPARSAVVGELLVDVRVEVEVVAYKPLGG